MCPNNRSKFNVALGIEAQASASSSAAQLGHDVA